MVANATINRSTLKQFLRHWEYGYYSVLCEIWSRVRKWRTDHGSKQMRFLTVGYSVNGALDVGARGAVDRICWLRSLLGLQTPRAAWGLTDYFGGILTWGAYRDHPV